MHESEVNLLFCLLREQHEFLANKKASRGMVACSFQKEMEL